MHCRPVLLALVLLVLSAVNAHPPVTFTMLLDAPNPDTTVGVPYNLTFYLYDMLNNFNTVNFTQLVPIHARKLHVMLASFDMDTVYHLHPEDYSTPAEMSLRDNYFVTLTFPKAGRWYMATSFMANITGKLREGAAQIEFVVPGTSPSPPKFNFTDQGFYPTYPIPANERFDNPINVNTNVATIGGYKVKIKTETLSMQNVSAYTCQVFYLTVTDSNGLQVKNFVPYLDAPLHMVFVAEDDTVYHGHGMDLPGIAPTLAKVQEYARMMGMGMGGMTPAEDIVMMNAMMMGITNTGALNCTADLGALMQKYGMDPNEPMLPTSGYTFGPFFIGMFDFPNVGNWRAFIYFKLQIGNETQLLVPHFSLTSVNATVDPAPVDSAGIQQATSRLQVIILFVTFVFFCIW